MHVLRLDFVSSYTKGCHYSVMFLLEGKCLRARITHGQTSNLLFYCPVSSFSHTPSLPHPSHTVGQWPRQAALGSAGGLCLRHCGGLHSSKEHSAASLLCPAGKAETADNSRAGLSSQGGRGMEWEGLEREGSGRWLLQLRFPYPSSLLSPIISSLSFLYSDHPIFYVDGVTGSL